VPTEHSPCAASTSVELERQVLHRDVKLAPQDHCESSDDAVSVN
jgi:hypothetical protein